MACWLHSPPDDSVRHTFTTKQPSTMSGHTPNLILNRLSATETERLLPRLEKLSFAQAAVIAEPGDHLEYTYFPVGCVLSTIVVLKNGASVETATTGNEGVVEIGCLIGRPR